MLHLYSDKLQESLLLTQNYLVQVGVYLFLLVNSGGLHFFVYVKNKEKIQVLPKG